MRFYLFFVLGLLLVLGACRETNTLDATQVNPTGVWIGPNGGRLVITRLPNAIEVHHRQTRIRHYAQLRAPGLFETQQFNGTRTFFVRYNFVGPGQLRVVRVFSDGQQNVRVFRRDG